MSPILVNFLNFPLRKNKEFQFKINHDPIVFNILKEDNYKTKLEDWNKKFVILQNLNIY